MKNENTKGNAWLPSLIIVVVLVIIAGFSCIHFNNSINAKYQDTKMQYSQIETVLQRRNDLIPNLTSAVRGDMHNEQKIFDNIAKARSDFNSAKSAKEKFKASNEVNKSTNLLIKVIRENYPKLNSDKRVADLMVELEGSENRIATERQKYNQSVNDYTVTITNFPGSLFASGRSKLAYFEADKGAEKVPKVDLDK